MVRCRRIAFLGLVSCLALAALLGWWRAGISAVRDSSPVQQARGPIDPSSCKPSAPVNVALSSARPGAWHLEIRALETANEVSVHLGSSTGGQTDSRQEIWRGPLSAGQVRSLDVSFSPPPGATSVWAEAQVTTGSTTILRAGAVVPTAAATLVAGAPRGTVLVDPASGESVVEYPGRVQR